VGIQYQTRAPPREHRIINLDQGRIKAKINHQRSWVHGADDAGD